MAIPVYIDFNVTVRRLADGSYRISSEADGAQSEDDFVVPFDADERAAIRGVIRQRARDFGSPAVIKGNSLDQWEEMKKRGEQLHDALFETSVGKSWASKRDWVLQQPAPHGLRLRLHLDAAAELADLPWEYLYDRERQTFLVLREQTPIVRHFNHPDPAARPLVKPPINMLLMLSDAGPALDIEGEFQRIKQALKPLEDGQILSLTRVPAATTQALQDTLDGGRAFHIFHYIGHSGFDDKKNPVLLLKDGTMTAERLVNLLDPFSLRLVVLNSCESAASPGADTFSGLAHGLVKSGIPAVVAMGFKISDDAAQAFAAGFYQQIAANQPVEISVARGRRAIFARDNNPTEWGTPVLFMRGKDSRLFSLDLPSEEQVRQREIDTLTAKIRVALDQKQYDLAIELLQKIKAVLAKMLLGG